jgi:hypothetical protein
MSATNSHSPLFTEAELEQVLLEKDFARLIEVWMKMGLFAGTGILVSDIQVYLTRRLRQISESRSKAVDID